ncbi:hypothetical protein TrCOL_g825 [Triparma columacea]|uniref:Uncharacterized protein n=1 Tax=Triparma columacea TaxID=722753 RepID=A0A9W7L710_9STRA|nr:hypothetical protein TrCOL_g825 [Triparma columacea]
MNTVSFKRAQDLLKRAHETETNVGGGSKRFKKLLGEAWATDARFRFGIDIVRRVYIANKPGFAKHGLALLLDKPTRKRGKVKGGKIGKNHNGVWSLLKQITHVKESTLVKESASTQGDARIKATKTRKRREPKKKVKTVKKILAVPEEREEVKEWEISPQEEQRSMEANEEESQKIEEEKKRGERGENVVEVRMGTRAPSIYEHDPVDINSGDHVLFRARDPPLLVVLPKGEGCDKFEEELDKFVTRQDKEVHGKGKKRASTERLRVLFEERETECKELAKKFGGEVLPITKRKSREDREKSENIYYVQNMNERIANKLCVQVPFNPELTNDVQVGSAKSEGNEATNIGYVAVRWSYIEEILKEETKDLKSALSKLPGDMENLTDESTGSIQSANGFYTELGLQSMANSTDARWRSGKEKWQPPSGKLHKNTKDLETKRKVEATTAKVLSLSNKILNSVAENCNVPLVKNFIVNQYKYDPRSLSPEAEAITAATNFCYDMCEAGDLAFYVSQLAVRLAGERPEDALAYAADTASNLDVSKCLWGRHSGYADVHQDKLDSNTRMNGMMTIYNALYKWDNEEQMVNDKKMERLIELVFNEKREQYKSPTFSEIRKEVNNLKDMYKEKAAGTYKSSPHPCPGNDLIAHDPDGCGCAKMQTLHEDFLIFATNQTTNLHCNVYPDDDGDGACDTRRGEEDYHNATQNHEGTSPEQTHVFTDRLIVELRNVNEERVEALLQASKVKDVAEKAQPKNKPAATKAKKAAPKKAAGKKAKGRGHEEVDLILDVDEYEVLAPKRSRTNTFPNLPAKKAGGKKGRK